MKNVGIFTESVNSGGFSRPVARFAADFGVSFNIYRSVRKSLTCTDKRRSLWRTEASIRSGKTPVTIPCSSLSCIVSDCNCGLSTPPFPGTAAVCCTSPTPRGTYSGSSVSNCRSAPLSNLLNTKTQRLFSISIARLTDPADRLFAVIFIGDLSIITARLTTINRRPAREIITLPRQYRRTIQPDPPGCWGLRDALSWYAARGRICIIARRFYSERTTTAIGHRYRTNWGTYDKGNYFINI